MHPYSFDNKLFQKFLTTIDLRSNTMLHDEKFDLTQMALKQSWYTSFGMQHNISLSGFRAILKRSSTPFVMNIYLPTGLLTLASFIGFLIPVDMVPGRMGLLVTTFLMLVNIRSTQQRVGPVVS